MNTCSVPRDDIAYAGHRAGKENADDLLAQMRDLQNQKKAQEEQAAEKLAALHRKAKTIGNYVHESVPVSTTEVGHTRGPGCRTVLLILTGEG